MREHSEQESDGWKVSHVSLKISSGHVDRSVIPPCANGPFIMPSSKEPYGDAANSIVAYFSETEPLLSCWQI